MSEWGVEIGKMLDYPAKKWTQYDARGQVIKSDILIDLDKDNNFRGDKDLKVYRANNETTSVFQLALGNQKYQTAPAPIMEEFSRATFDVDVQNKEKQLISQLLKDKNYKEVLIRISNKEKDTPKVKEKLPKVPWVHSFEAALNAVNGEKMLKAVSSGNMLQVIQAMDEMIIEDDVSKLYKAETGKILNTNSISDMKSIKIPKQSLTIYTEKDMQRINSIKNFIMQKEGFKPSWDECPAGYLTIGYGHKLCKSEDPTFLQNATSITQEEANALLLRDIKKHYRDMKKALGEDVLKILNEKQIHALTSLSFNYPIKEGNCPKLIAALKEAAKEQDLTKREKLLFKAQAEMNIFKTGETSQPGLVIRRIEEMMMFMDNRLCEEAEKRIIQSGLNSTAASFEQIVANKPEKINNDLFKLLESIVAKNPRNLKKQFGEDITQKLSKEQILAINSFSQAKAVDFSKCAKFQTALKSALNSKTEEDKIKYLELAQAEMDVFKNNPILIEKQIKEMKMLLNGRLGEPAQLKILKTINRTYGTNYSNLYEIITKPNKRIDKQIICTLKESLATKETKVA